MNLNLELDTTKGVINPQESFLRSTRQTLHPKEKAASASSVILGKAAPNKHRRMRKSHRAPDKDGGSVTSAQGKEKGKGKEVDVARDDTDEVHEAARILMQMSKDDATAYETVEAMFGPIRDHEAESGGIDDHHDDEELDVEITKTIVSMKGRKERDSKHVITSFDGVKEEDRQPQGEQLLARAVDVKGKGKAKPGSHLTIVVPPRAHPRTRKGGAMGSAMSSATPTNIFTPSLAESRTVNSPGMMSESDGLPVSGCQLPSDQAYNWPRDYRQESENEQKPYLTLAGATASETDMDLTLMGLEIDHTMTKAVNEAAQSEASGYHNGSPTYYRQVNTEIEVKYNINQGKVRKSSR